MTANMFLEVAFVVCCGVHVAVASFSSAACWQGGFSREFCCDTVRDPSGVDACWDAEFTFLRCCNVEDLHQAPSATRVWGEACWAGDAPDLFTRCCSGSGNPLCWDDTRQYETCCQSTAPSPLVASNDPSVRCLEEVGFVTSSPHLASCKEDHLFFEVSHSMYELWSDSSATEPWFLRFRDTPRDPSVPESPWIMRHVGNLCVPHVCSEETVGTWLAPMLASWWLPHERVVRTPVPWNDTHVVLPPRLGFRRRQFVHHHEAWVTFGVSQASEPFHFVVWERPQSWRPQSWRWQLGLLRFLVTLACPVMCAGVLESLGINVRFLQPLAPQRSVREALTASGVTCVDACRVWCTVGVLLLHTSWFNDWRHKDNLRWALVPFRNVNGSFATLSIFLCLRNHRGGPKSWRHFVQRVVSRFLRVAPVVWLGLYLQVVIPLRLRGWIRHRCLQPPTLLSTLFFVHEITFLRGSPCGIIDIFESLFHVELCLWIMASTFGDWLGPCALILWPISVILDTLHSETGTNLSTGLHHRFAELLPPALATAAVHCGLKGKMRSKKLWLWGASSCLFTSWILFYCEEKDLGPLVRWRKAEFQLNRQHSFLLQLWKQSVILPQTVALVITLNLFDHGGFSQNVGVLRPFLALCSRLCPLVLALHAIFFHWVDDYGRFSFDGSVFGFIGEFVANVLCCFLLASPVYVIVQVPANLLAENFRTVLTPSVPADLMQSCTEVRQQPMALRTTPEVHLACGNS